MYRAEGLKLGATHSRNIQTLSWDRQNVNSSSTKTHANTFSIEIRKSSDTYSIITTQESFTIRNTSVCCRTTMNCRSLAFFQTSSATAVMRNIATENAKITNDSWTIKCRRMAKTMRDRHSPISARRCGGLLRIRTRQHQHLFSTMLPVGFVASHKTQSAFFVSFDLFDTVCFPFQVSSSL